MKIAKELVAYLTPGQAAVLYWVVFLAAAYLVWGLLFVAIPRSIWHGKAKVAKANLHTIQLVVERYAVDYEGDYPFDVYDVITAGYIDEFPETPFSGQPMRAYPPGSEVPPGDFVYEPIGTAGRYIDQYHLILVY